MAADWICGSRVPLTAEIEGNSVGHQDRAGPSSAKRVPQWMQQHCSWPRAGTGTGRNQLSAEHPTAFPTLQWSTGAQAGPGEAENRVLELAHSSPDSTNDKTDSGSPFHQKFSSLIKNQRKWVWSQLQPSQSSTCTQGQPPVHRTMNRSWAELVLPHLCAATQPRAGLWQTPAQAQWSHVWCCRSRSPQLGGTSAWGSRPTAKPNSAV